MMQSSWIYNNKSKEQILSEFLAPGGSVVHEQQKMAIIVRCTQDLETKFNDLTATINQANNESKTLNERLYFLNIILTIATVIGVIATLLESLKAIGIIGK